MPVVTAAFKTWLKSSTNIKLGSDASVARITREGIVSYESLLSFKEKGFQNLPSNCSKSIEAIAEDPANGISAEAAVAGAHISAISVQRLIVASYAARYYKSISRSMTASSMHYDNGPT